MSVATPERSELESALVDRLGTALAVLSGAPAPTTEPAGTAPLLEQLVLALREDPTASGVWLALAAVTAALPFSWQVRDGLRMFRRAPTSDLMLWLLDQAFVGEGVQAAAAPLEIVTGEVLVDVDHTARHDLHTGVQRVVRQFLPRWVAERGVVPAAWSRSFRCLRRLSPAETWALSWNGAPPEWSGETGQPGTPGLVIPWRSVVVLAEVPSPAACERLAALAEHSGSAVVALGHDCIPVISADLVPEWEPERFTRYLTVIKHCRRVATVGESAAGEFRGFVDALPAQGLCGPEVVACPLANEAVGPILGASGPDPVGGPPVVLCVGTFEPRKNQLAVLYAAERLWREGLRFELWLYGGSGWGEDLPERVAQLQRAGRAVTTATEVPDADLLAAYRRARFTVFPSLHEGFGLPVVESLSAGTPVVTGDYGATAESASAGGAVTIDPRDDEALVAAMRRLLTDDATIERLRAEAAARPERTWRRFSAELWDRLVAPELSTE